jgi:hypothetical protein
VSTLDIFATQTVGLRRKVSEESGWGEATYEPAEPADPEEIECVYEPGYSDSGRDGATRFRGRVMTTTELNLGDLIIGDLDAEEENAQEVTDVTPQYGFDGSLDFYEALL